MSAYKFTDPNGIYFITFTVVEWVNVFAREEYVSILIDSLSYCQEKKGLKIYGWVIMTNHLHLIISKSETGNELSDIVRDFKKFTSKQVIKAIQDNLAESRKNWLLWIFKNAGSKNPNNKHYQFWQRENHSELLVSNKFLDQKIDYIHQNPIKAGIVDEPEHYRYSSAKDYADLKGLLPIEILE